MDGQEDSLDLASRLSSILLELCEVGVFLLSWPEPSVLFSSGLCKEIFFLRLQKLPWPLHWRASLVIGCEVNNEKLSLYSVNPKTLKNYFGF